MLQVEVLKDQKFADKLVIVLPATGAHKFAICFLDCTCTKAKEA